MRCVGQSGLLHWARQKLHCNNELKAYFREHGLLLISDWALLADSSERRTRQAWELFGAGSMGTEQAVALSRAYRAHYPQAMAAHRQRSGRRSGWQPDGAFLEQLDPSLSAREVFERLQRLAACLRRLRSGQWQRGSGEAPEDREAELADPASLADPMEGDGLGWSSGELGPLIAAALQRAMDRLMPAVLRAGGRDGALLQCLWQGYGEGLSNRPLAQRCGCAAGTVSKKLQLQQHAGAIATAAAVELKRHGAFAEVMGSVEGCERLVAALRNHLLEPEREGVAAPLRRWVQTFLPEGS